MSYFHSDIHLADYAVIRVEVKGGAWIAALEVHGWRVYSVMGNSYDDAVAKVVNFILDIRGNSYGVSFQKRIQALGLDKLGRGEP